MAKENEKEKQESQESTEIIKSKNTGALLPGIILFLIGIYFMLIQFGVAKSENFWPIFVLGPGIGFMAMYFYSKDKEKNAGLLIPGSITTLLGIFFFYLSFTSWDKMSFLWPIFPLIIGLSYYLFYFAGNMKDRSILIPASILTIIGIFFLFLGVSSFKYWPLILVVAGLFLIYNNFRRPQPTQQKSSSQVKEDKK